MKSDFEYAVLFLVLFALTVPALAQSTKCTVNGKVLYTDGECPKGAKQEVIRGADPAADRYLPPSHLSTDDVAGFAARLYDISVYTAEEVALKRIVAAEVELVVSRWLGKKISVSDHYARSRLPARWEDMVSHMRKILGPVVDSHLAARASAMKAAGLEGRSPYVQEYAQLVAKPKQRPNIQFADGTSTSNGGSSQASDMREILAFHSSPAAAKWRGLWPDLRVYGAQMAALHYRVMADASLGPAQNWNDRAVVLMRRIGGRVLAPGEWEATGSDRLGFTMSGLGRFLLPLGTEMRTEAPEESITKIDGSGPGLVISQYEGPRMSYRLLDSRWASDISKRLLPGELQQIDVALTASWVEAKGRWFAPLELEFDGYYNVSKRMRSSPEMRRVYQSFSERSSEVMTRAWDGWQGK